MSAPEPFSLPGPDGGPLESLLETLAEGVIVLDAGLTVVAVNGAAERMLGRPRRRLLGLERRAARIRFFREDGRPWRELDDTLEALARGEADSISALACRVLRPDRTFADVLLSARRLAWTGGLERDVLLTLSDVTARRRAEIAGREAEERLRAVVDSAFDGLVAVDSGGLVMEFNAAAEAMFRTTRDAVLGRRFEELLGERERDQHRELRMRLLANPTRRPVRHRQESRGRRADGEEFRAELAISSFVQGGRRVLAVLVRDLSGADQGELARRESVSRSRFLGAMSHQLRTPLNSILGFGQLLEREETGALNPRQRRYVEHVLAGGRTLLTMLDGVLDLTRMEAGELVLSPEAFDLAAGCREVVERLQPAAEAKGIRLTFEVPAGLAVRSDRARTVQVLGSLVGNALKFTPDAGSVRVTGQRVPEGVAMSVEDSGGGIPPSRQEDIFGAFVQADDQPTRRQEGAGLGLAVSRRLAEAMGGSLTVASELGQGSVFTLVLPSP